MNGVSEEVVSFEHNFVVFILLHDTFKILISEVILKKKLKKNGCLEKKRGTINQICQSTFFSTI